MGRLDRVRATGDAYDGVAEVYAERFGDGLEAQPFDRAMLTIFADFVRETGGPVADVGCGPGHVTAMLRELGLDAFGLDVSAAMLSIAAEARPRLPFAVAAMEALPVASGSLAGLLARYSVIHTPPDDLPAVLAEFARALAPGGHALVAFFAVEADAPLPFDHKVAPAFAWPAELLSRLLTTAGLTPVARLVREPNAVERAVRDLLSGHLLVQKS